MTDIYERVEKGQAGLKKVLDFIPGWEGYRKRDARRRADKLLRDKLADRLADQRGKLNAAQKDLVDRGRVDLIDDIESAVTQLKRLTDSLRFADYGYAGLFDAVKIKQDELKQLYDFDTDLIEYQSRLDAATGQLQDAISSVEGVSSTNDVEGVSSTNDVEGVSSTNDVEGVSSPNDVEGVKENIRAVQEIIREANSTFDKRKHLILGDQ